MILYPFRNTKLVATLCYQGSHTGQEVIFDLFFCFPIFENLDGIGQNQNKGLAKKVATFQLPDQFPIINCEHGSETFWYCTIKNISKWSLDRSITQRFHVNWTKTGTKHVMDVRFAQGLLEDLREPFKIYIEIKLSFDLLS